jgi:hypothetical protein
MERYEITFVPDQNGTHEYHGRRYFIEESGDTIFGNTPHSLLENRTPRDLLLERAPLIVRQFATQDPNRKFQIHITKVDIENIFSEQ